MLATDWYAKKPHKFDNLTKKLKVLQLIQHMQMSEAKNIV